MKKNIIFTFLWMSIIPLVSAQKDNQVILFDGKDASHWICTDGRSFKESGWEITDGTLHLKPAPDKKYTDLVTKEEYSDFELSFEFKTAAGSNSGVKYYFTKYEKGGYLGFEYQVLDDNANEDAAAGINGNHKTGSFYDMLPASADKELKPVGAWNSAKIISKGSHIEHWLNGRKILEFENGSPRFMEALKLSKFKNTDPVFGSTRKGKILLQYHLTEVWFRNINIRII